LRVAVLRSAEQWRLDLKFDYLLIDFGNRQQKQKLEEGPRQTRGELTGLCHCGEGSDLTVE
ncbi:Hypothetical predicted protein, partial [Olea europaea subsp. europaea]